MTDIQFETMRTIHIELPENVDLKDFELLMILASKLYDDGILSAGQAAKAAGISKRTFIELLGKYGVSMFSNSVTDLHSDLANA